MQKSSPTRGPLRAIVMAKTGQDVRACMSCTSCEGAPTEGWSMGEVLRAAARDDERCLTSPTLWSVEILREHSGRCQAGIDVRSVFETLKAEALVRNLIPPKNWAN